MMHLPQVNLLPPEVTAARALDVLKRWLALGVLGVVILTAGGYLVATAQAQSAENALADANNRTTSLLGEKKKYVEVTTVLTNLSVAKSAMTLASSTEVDWASYITAVAAVSPGTVSIDQVIVQSATPMTLLQDTGDVLASPVLARLTFTGRLTAPVDMSDWLDALAAVPGFVDPNLASLAIAGDDTTDPYWVVTGSISLTSEALAHRFDTTEEQK